jgi:sterol 3beta-glucosyltransferase
MAGGDPQATTRIVLKALEISGQRGVLSRGWAGLGDAELPREVLLVDEVPHDWLFPRMAAVVHHGGAGTTAAGLRAGIPTVIAPYFGDQFFWGQRVQALGVGPAPIPQKRLTSQALAAAIQTAVQDPTMRSQARRLGDRIRQENGVAEAVGLIHHYLGLAQPIGL